MLLALLLSVLPAQDDVSKWILQLESETLVEREEATRRLQSLGPAGVERLQKARDAARDAEVKARLDAIILHIGKTAELAKAFGPTRRVTLAARGRPLKEILADFVVPGIATIDAGDLDPEARLDIQIRDATWWEGLDRAARAAGARYEIKDNGDGQFNIVLVRGKEPEGPVVYAEQFRISVVEAKRLDYRTPAGKIAAAMAVVELRHQPDLKPGGRTYGDVLRFDAVRDAKGEDAKADRPGWAGSTMVNPRQLGLQADVWIRADAALPLTLSGTSDLSFPSETREIALDLAGEGSKVKVGKVELRVSAFSSSGSGARLTLRAEAVEDPELSDRLVGLSPSLLDAKGEKHRGSMRSGTMSGDYCSWDFEFSSGIAAPKKVVLRWVAEFHRVRIPFRLEGVRLP